MRCKILVLNACMDSSAFYLTSDTISSPQPLMWCWKGVIFCDSVVLMTLVRLSAQLPSKPLSGDQLGGASPATDSSVNFVHCTHWEGLLLPFNSLDPYNFSHLFHTLASRPNSLHGWVVPAVMLQLWRLWATVQHGMQVSVQVEKCMGMTLIWVAAAVVLDEWLLSGCSSLGTCGSTDYFLPWIFYVIYRL